jgi:endoglucanase
MRTFGRCTLRIHLALWLLLCLLNAPAQAAGWLATSGNRIVNSDGSVWIGRGANIHDTRSCGGGTLVDGTPINDNATGVAEVKRRIDVLTDQWRANFIRLVLESRRPQDSYVADANYRSRIREIVDYIGTKPGVYVLVSVWLDPSLDANGWPTVATNAILAQLAQDFYASPHVLYGVSNEPESNFDGAQDAQVWTRMNDAVAAIRAAESALGPNRHIVTVQGTRDWARDLSYYVSHPITAGGGVNVAYETHIYNSPSDFASLLLASPSRTIPVIVGEFGPVNDEWHSATVNDMQTLMDMAKAHNISHLAWTFHQYCPPNLFADTPGAAWNADSTTPNWIGMPIFPTDFGQLLIDNLLPSVLLNTSLDYGVTSTDDNVTRAATAQVSRRNDLGAERRPVVVLMPGWSGMGDVPAVRNTQALMFADQGYVAMNVGLHQTNSGTWYSDLAESVKAALDALCVQGYADCSAVVITGESYGGTQTHPVVRYLHASGAFDGSGGANAGRKVVGILAQDSGYTQYWAAPIDADATAYSIAMIENLGDSTFPVDSCAFGNCGTRNRADYHRNAPGSQYVLSYCPAGGTHGSRGYTDWDAWVLSAVKTMLHDHRGVPRFAGYVEPSLAVSNACVTELSPHSQVDCLFNWAERTYTALFAPASNSISVAPWRYRYYSQTDTYLGTSSADNHLYYLGPSSGNALLDVGNLSTWLATAGCQ